MAPPSAEPVRAAVITISTSRAAGEGDDEGGDALTEFAASLGAELAGREVIPDDLDLISQRLVHWADAEGCDLVLTTGGTGFSPNDLTPEATRAVIDREAPGIPEAMRAASRPAHPPLDALARCRRHPRHHPDRELPGQPEEHRRGG